MDPVATQGTQQAWSAADERALSLIGWDAGPVVVPASISGTVYHDVNFSGAYDSGGPDFGMASVRVFHDANDNGQFDSGIEDRYVPAAEVPLEIPDEGVVESQIIIDDLPGTVRDVNVTLDIEHTYTYDLEVTLISPSGRTVTLFDDVGQDPFDSENFSGTTLDDEAGTDINDGRAPFSGLYRPQEPLSLMDGDTINGTWTLRIRDWAFLDVGQLLDWHLSFDSGTGEPSALSDSEGRYELANLAPGTYRLRQQEFQGFRQTEPAAGGAHVVALADGQQVTGRNFGSTDGIPPSSIAGRHVFYNRSAFDGNSAATNAADDTAIATDKSALLPGQAATFAHYTSYSRGINGVMVDVAGLPEGNALGAADFSFKVGNDDSPWAWSDAPAPTISVRRGAGAAGSDRVTLTWPDGTIVGQWLQVTVWNTDNTGLRQSDVFYFGNRPGETGNATDTALVTVADVLAVRNALNQRGRALTDRNDFNRDGRINASDFAVARGAMGSSLHLFSSASASAPQPDEVTVAPAPARRTAYRPLRVWDETAPGVL